MEHLLLTTKLQVPPQSHNVVYRARLIETLESGIHPYKLTHITAPAGYGKTTLLVQWTHFRNRGLGWWLPIFNLSTINPSPETQQFYNKVTYENQLSPSLCGCDEKFIEYESKIKNCWISGMDRLSQDKVLECCKPYLQLLNYSRPANISPSLNRYVGFKFRIERF